MTDVLGTLGVIGGMGPAATVDFLRRVIDATPAQRDQDHLHIILDNDPSVPDRTAAIEGKGPDPSPQLAAIASRLELAGADTLVMPCNSAHHFADAITRAVSIPLLDWPAIVAKQAVAQGARSAGILATTGTVTAGVYKRALEECDCATVEPLVRDQDEVMSVITEIKEGEYGEANALDRIRLVAGTLVEQGADVLVLACTELSALTATRSLATSSAVPLLDASDVVARHVVSLAYPSG